MYNVFIWIVGVGFIIFVLWQCGSFLRWIFGFGKPRNEIQWDHHHLCEKCQSPTVIMQFNPAMRLCFSQCGYWTVGSGPPVWHSLDPTLPQAPDYYFSRN
jgi:hypothetical protein